MCIYRWAALDTPVYKSERNRLCRVDSHRLHIAVPTVATARLCLGSNRKEGGWMDGCVVSVLAPLLRFRFHLPTSCSEWVLDWLTDRLAVLAGECGTTRHGTTRHASIRLVSTAKLFGLRVRARQQNRTGRQSWSKVGGWCPHWSRNHY